MHRQALALVGFGLSFVAGFPCRAQFQDGSQSMILELPRISQRAVVTQRIGVTDVTIVYHRPSVAGRKVWGGIVPYGQVWRAGANENTTIELSHPMTVEGKALGKGIYGLHMIPGEKDWTIIFSKSSSSWGSSGYDPAEDALRVTVQPHPSDFHEALAYDFDELKPDSSAVTLRWEKLAVPFRVTSRVNEIVEKSLPLQLRGYAKFLWYPWNEAAMYLVENQGNLNEALKYSDQSIRVEERFDNWLTKSRVLGALGQKDESVAARRTALQKASAVQAHLYARTLILQGKQREEALKVFRENAKKHPKEWFVHGGMARVYTAQGDFANAVKEMKVAWRDAPEDQKLAVEQLVKRLQAKEDINK